MYLKKPASGKYL